MRCWCVCWQLQINATRRGRGLLGYELAERSDRMPDCQWISWLWFVGTSIDSTVI
jgi:hypothetical protein